MGWLTTLIRLIVLWKPLLALEAASFGKNSNALGNAKILHTFSFE